MTKKKTPKDPPEGPDQVEGGVQPADAKPLTEEDHGSYADEANRQNEPISVEVLQAVDDKMAAEHDDKHGGKVRVTRAEMEAARDSTDPPGTRFFGADVTGAPVGLLASDDESPRTYRNEYLGLDRGGAVGLPDEMTFEEFKAAARRVMASPSDLLALCEQYPAFAQQMRDEIAADIAQAEALPGHSKPQRDMHLDALKAQIEGIARKSLDSRRGDAEQPEQQKTDKEREFLRLQNNNRCLEQWVRDAESERDTLRARVGRIESRKTFQVGDAPAVWVPRIGDTVLVFLAAHCSFRRAPVPASVDLAAVTDEQRAAAATNTVRVLEPLPAIVTHLGDDAFAVEVFGARAKVHETFRFNDYDHLGNRFSGWWVWPEP